jgi:hypothetical protein
MIMSANKSGPIQVINQESGLTYTVSVVPDGLLAVDIHGHQYFHYCPQVSYEDLIVACEKFEEGFSSNSPEEIRKL